MSFVHHVPDLEKVRCLGCDERIDRVDLIKHGTHGGLSCCFWHPFHFWCIRVSSTPPVSALKCADCNERLPLKDVRAVIEWGLTANKRLHEPRKNKIKKPKSLVLVRVSPKHLALLREGAWRQKGSSVLGPELETFEEYTRQRFEVVHADGCPTGDDDDARWSLKTDEDRQVYADWLEEKGNLAGAELVRLSIEHRRLADRNDRSSEDVLLSPGLQTTAIGLRLKQLRGELPSAWCRKVLRS